jgi:ABC-type lipoprotein release transport system permease subunit
VSGFRLRARVGVTLILFPSSRRIARSMRIGRTTRSCIARAVRLAAIGLYGVMSYTVARRTNEIGIRLALGAPRATVARLVVGDILLLVAAGAIAGALASFGPTRYASNLIFGLTPNEPLTFIAATIVLLAVGLLAGYLPARRRSIRSLRYVASERL